MREKIDYGVVILNYNTAEDSINAAKSVVKNAEEYSYVVCIVDNNSPNKNDLKKLESFSLRNVCFIRCPHNSGYAAGNNYGITYLNSKYDIQYIIIMNPDVTIINTGTIDRLLYRLESLTDNYCGIQPFVWTPYLGAPEWLIHIRKVYNYFDMVISSFHLFKLLFKGEYNSMVYRNQMPYKNEMDFEVPSGAFFIMKNNAFEKVNYFDEDTFLYQEEMILGYKLKKEGFVFRFVPNEIVEHEGGKSTGSNTKRVRRKTLVNEKKAAGVYLRKYLKVCTIKIWIVYFLMELNWFIKQLFKCQLFCFK